MEVGSIGPHFTGHDDEPIDEEDFARFYDDVTRQLLLGHLFRAARQETNQVLERVSCVQESPRGERKGERRCHGSVV